MQESQSWEAAPTVPCAAEDVERICDAFEAAWQKWRDDGADAPRIEAFLSRCSPPARGRALHELLLLEFEYRALRGDLHLEEYVQRLPADQDAVYGAYRRYSEEFGLDEVDDGFLTATSRLRLVGMHREGGLGRVWMGRDETIGRPVAVKEIRPAYTDHSEAQARFLQEAELTGQLEHPGIVPVYALGRRPDGRPFYAMRLIQGLSLAEALQQFHEGESTHPHEQHRLEMHKLLGRFVDVCNAIAYAHSRGILHRDLKPDNIMLGKYGETLVVDWGLAKTSTDAVPYRAPEDDATPPPVISKGSAPTQRGAAMGTPPFMSPEQAGAHGETIGTFTDVFGLGATLYCLLTGSPPYVGGHVRQVVDRAKKGDYTRPTKLKPGTSRKLEAICLKAMAFRPEDRYGSARALGEDVERWLADEPIAALPDSFRDRVWRWAKRNRTWVAALVFVLVFITVASVVGTLVINALRLQTQQARGEAERQLFRAEHALYATQVARAERYATTEPSMGLELLNDASACSEPFREFAWHYLYRSCRRERVVWTARAQETRLAAFTDDPDRVISVDAGGFVKLWNTRTASLESTIKVEQPITTAAISRDRSRFVLACEDGSIRVGSGWPETEITRLASVSHPVICLAVTRDGKHVAVLHQGEDNPIVVWNVPSAEIVARFQGPAEAMSLAFSPDGKLLAAGGLLHGSSSDAVLVWDVAQQRELPCPQPYMHEGIAQHYSLRVSSLSFSEDNRLLFAGTELGVLARINLRQRTLRQRWGHSGTIWAIHPGPRDSPVVFSAGVGTESRPGIYAPMRPLVLWNSDTLESITAMAGVSAEVTGLDFHEETGRLLVTQQNGILVLLDCTEQWVHTDLFQGAAVDALAFSSDGETLIAAGVQPGSSRLVLRHWDPRTGQLSDDTPKIESESGLLVMPSGAILPESRSPSADRRTEELVDALTGRIIGRLTVEKGERIAAISSDHRFVAVCTGTRELKLWDIQMESITATLHASAPMNSKSRVVFAAAAPRLAWASAARRGRIEVWNLSSRTRLGTMEGLAGRVRAVAFSPCGNVLAVGHATMDPTDHRGPQTKPASVTLFDLPSCTLRATMKAHAGDVCAMAFSPDGRTLATGSLDWKVRLWEPASAVHMLTMEHHTNAVLAVAFAPDGQTLASAGPDQRIRLWRAATPAFVVEREAWGLVQRLSADLPCNDDRTTYLRGMGESVGDLRRRALQIAENDGMTVLQEGGGCSTPP